MRDYKNFKTDQNNSWLGCAGLILLLASLSTVAHLLTVNL